MQKLRLFSLVIFLAWLPACVGELAGDFESSDPSGADAGTDEPSEPLSPGGGLTGQSKCDGTDDDPASCNPVCNVDVTSCKHGDGCCPDGCHALNDDDCESSCGNDVVEAGETCDGACPTECNDGDRCTTDTLSGDPSTCDVSCGFTDITMCIDGDGCCPDGCDETTDDDCSIVCGNDVVELGETCDAPETCPTDCDDGDACTTDRLAGSPETCDAQCLYSTVTQCVDGDGCCPNGCDANLDDDCAATCGNDVVEASETCDGDCPTECNDGDACTIGTLTGDAASCTAECQYAAIDACVDGDGCCPTGCTSANDDDCNAVCGNDVVEPGETCDGDCPTSCDDADACTVDTLAGDAATCTAECEYDSITACVDGDGCCPAACNATNDDDCNAVCGNDVIESGETCDGDCPTNCDDGDACTADTLAGDAATCTAECQYSDITMCVAGDGCCPSGCDETNDADCSAVCGNGVIESGETCDPTGSCPTNCDDGDACTNDSLMGDANACTAMCSYSDVTACTDGDGCCPTGCTYDNDDDCPVVIDCRDPAAWPSSWTTLEDAILAETNARRTQPQTCGTASFPAQTALNFDARLREAARCHALDMATNNFFSHTGSDGSSAGQRIDTAGYPWKTYGENIAAGNSTATAIVDQWMNSTGHCENIMNGNVEDLGVGYAFDADATYDHYSVQVFGRE